MFWVLITLALAGFIPCILLPVWRDYQAMSVALRTEEQVTEQMRDEVAAQRRRIDILRTDPAVSIRLAQRELSYDLVGFRQVPVPGATPTKTITHLQPPGPVQPPPAATRLLKHLPQADYDAIFCDPATRGVVMILCAGTAAAAFILYKPKW